MTPAWLEFRTRAGRHLTSSSGQGIVEYILVLVVVIAVALAVSAAFFKPFNEWARNYMGDYIYCLLDEGELPSLGGEEAISDCEKGFEDFTFGGGRPARANAGSGDDDEKGSRNRLNQANGGNGGGGGVRGRARGRRAASNIGEGFDSGAQNAKGKSSDVTSNFSRRIVIRNQRAGGGGTSITGRNRTEAYVGITGYIAQEQERIKRREAKIRSVGKSTGDAGSFARGGVKTVPYDFNPRKPAEFDITSGDWSFGEWLRILLILVIIIALVLFVGGQVAQISKSMEKE